MSTLRPSSPTKCSLYSCIHSWRRSCSIPSALVHRSDLLARKAASVSSGEANGSPVMSSVGGSAPTSLGNVRLASRWGAGKGFKAPSVTGLSTRCGASPGLRHVCCHLRLH